MSMMIRYTGLLLLALLLAGCPSPDRPKRQPPLTFAPDTLPAATVGVAYTQTVTAANASTPMYQLELTTGALPPGLSYVYDKDAETGTIAGTPTEAGSYSITLAGSCFGTQVSGQQGTVTYTITVAPSAEPATPAPSADSPPAP